MKLCTWQVLDFSWTSELDYGDGMPFLCNKLEIVPELHFFSEELQEAVKSMLYC